MIATLTGQAEERGMETTIVTGDLDMLQLVTEHTRLMVSLRGGVANTVIYDLARMDERWGLRPDQMLDYKALKGDATDNIPGVPGVGEKTAAKLVATFGTLDALYERIDEVTPERLRPLLAEAHDRVLDSRDLQRLVRDVPVELDLDAARLGVYDRDAVVGLFREYEFRSLIDRLPPLQGETADEAAGRLRETTGDMGSARAPGAPPRAAGTQPRGAAPNRARPAQSDGLQLSLDFDAVGPAPAAPAVPLEPLPPGDLRAALGRPRRGSGRVERGDVAAAGGPGVVAGDAPRRRRSPPPRRPAPAGGHSARARPRGRGRPRHHVRGSGGGDGGSARARGRPDAARGPRGQAAPGRPLRRRPRRRPDARQLRHADRRLPPQRRAAQPGDRRRRARAARHRPASGRRRPDPR